MRYLIFAAILIALSGCGGGFTPATTPQVQAQAQSEMTAEEEIDMPPPPPVYEE